MNAPPYANLTARHERMMVFARAEADAKARTVPVCFATETPYRRWFGDEILDCKPTSVRMARMVSGAAVLVNHDADHHVGVVESARCEEGKCRATIRFGRSPEAEQCLQDVLDGIRTGVSVGYQVHRAVLEKHDEQTGDTYRVTDWEPLEISLASVPADPGAGVGRSATIPPSAPPPPATPAPASKEPVMETTAAPVTTTAADLAAERKRVAEITALGRRFNRVADADKAVESGTPLDEFRAAVLAAIPGPAVVPAPGVQTPAPEIGMGRRDLAQYSLVRAINCLADKRPVDGLEKEASDAEAKRVGRTAGGFFVPADVLNASFVASQRALAMLRDPRTFTRQMTAGTAADGGNLVATDLLSGSMIEMLRNLQAVLAMGATQLTGLVGNVAIPSQTAAGTAAWRTEVQEVSASKQTLGQVTMSPNRCAALTIYSKQLLAQSSIDIEAFIRMDLATIIALAIDYAAIQGTGGAQPQGVVGASGVGALTFGGAPTWAKVVEFETTAATANALTGRLGYLTTPATRGKWKTTEQATGTARWLWSDGDQVNGYRALATNQVASNKVIFGNWADMIIGLWAGLDITVDPYKYAELGEVRVVANQFVDVALRHAASFVVSSDAGNQSPS